MAAITAPKAPDWLKKAAQSQPIQWFLFVSAMIAAIVLAVRWYIRKSQALDQVTLKSLPSEKDKIETITREQAMEAVKQARFFFFTNGYSALDVSGQKIAFMQKLINLSDYELGVINNLYNLEYVEKRGSDNLYDEISDDWGIGELAATKQRLLTRLRSIGAGQNRR
jgi:hypothetical protein